TWIMCPTKPGRWRLIARSPIRWGSAGITRFSCLSAMRRNGSTPAVKGVPRDPSRAKLERILGVRFKNTALLEEALTHKSYAMEAGGKVPFNERLEFLGDSVLSAAVAHYLFNRYPDVDEGRLSQLKSML